MKAITAGSSFGYQIVRLSVRYGCRPPLDRNFGKWRSTKMTTIEDLIFLQWKVKSKKGNQSLNFAGNTLDGAQIGYGSYGACPLKVGLILTYRYVWKTIHIERESWKNGSGSWECVLTFRIWDFWDGSWRGVLKTERVPFQSCWDNCDDIVRLSARSFGSNQNSH